VLERRHPERVVAFVMAGGEGKRLRPLTAGRCKPAVPFGSRYRIVDFALSNLVNSGIRSVYLLVQYRPQALIEHIRKGWALSPMLPDQFVTVVPPEMHTQARAFQGTADAVYQSLRLIELHHPDLVAIFAADHIYRMDVRPMIWFHRDHAADVTVAARPVPIEEAGDFGVIAADSNGRIAAFQEKPECPTAMPGDASHAYASMGIYLFTTSVLLEALDAAHKRSDTDFGRDILPRLLSERSVCAYDFSTNAVPGIKPYEETGYWRDVGTVDAYFAAHQDVLGAEPRFDMFNPQWPIYSSNYQGTVAHVLGGQIENCLLGAASKIHPGARLRNCIVRREAVVESDAELEDCIVMDYSRIGRGARLRRTIVERHNDIAPGETIGFDAARDAERYHVTPGGVAVVSHGLSSFFARGVRGSGFGYAE